MAAQPASPVPTISPAEMQILISRSGLVLNPGQMADLVLAWRQVAGLIASIPQERRLIDDAAFSFRLPPPVGQAAPPKPERQGAAKPTTKPATKAAANPTAKPAAKVAATPARKSTAKAAPGAAGKPAAKAAAKPVSRPRPKTKPKAKAAARGRASRGR